MLSDIQTFLKTVLGKPESELVEFKLAGKDYDTDKIYRYVSALANEANLKQKSAGYLILGVEPRNHTAMWTEYRMNEAQLNSLKVQVYQSTRHSIGIYSEMYDDKRLVIIEVPSAPQGIPISVNGHYYAREDENLVALSDIKRDEIRNQISCTDWSAEIITDASIADLDPQAILRARENFKQKHPKTPSAEINSWSDIEFLNRATLAKNGKITRASLILLGKPESARHLLVPYIARITWVLKDADGIEKDYEHFDPPFLLAVDAIYAKIRNLRYRYMQEGTLFPEEIDMYDPWVIRELLHNCIAHQDYTKQAKITLVEFEDGRLIFGNVGTFIPGSIEELIHSDAPPKIYRNPYLSTAMAEINMIDTIGSGVRRVFQTQKKRFFPMPTYSFTEDSVSVELFWKVLDTRYANLLAKHTNLSLLEIIALDKIQKGRAQEVEKTGIDLLKRRWLVEGRYPNIYLSSEVSNIIGKKEEYIKNRAMKDDFYREKIMEYINKHGYINKSWLRELLFDMLPKVLTEQKKETKVHNLIQSMKIEPYNLRIQWSRKQAKWIKSNDI